MSTLFALAALLFIGNGADAFVEQFPYASPEEAALIKNWVYGQKLEVDIVDALLTAEGVQDPAARRAFRAEIDTLIAALAPKAAGKGDKGARHLYKYLHKNVLYTYEPLARFQDLFHLGASYNCVTSTSIFAVGCTRLDIPFKLYLTPNHVFAAVTDTKGRVLRVEMTDPVKGFAFKTDIKDSIDYLKRYKLVTDAELQQKGERQVYLAFVNQALEIPLIDLVAVTYFNQTYAHRLQKRYAEGVRTIAKALLIDPSDTQSKELLQVLVGQFFTSYGFSETPLPVLAEVCRTSLRFLPDDPDFLKKVIDGALYHINDVHLERTPRDQVLGFLEELMLNLEAFPPLKRNVVRMHHALAAEGE